MSRTRTARVRPNRCQISASISASDSGCSLRASSSRASSAASSRHVTSGYIASPAQMYGCAVTLRGGLWVVWVGGAGVRGLAARRARQTKKKPGCSTFEWLEAAGQAASTTRRKRLAPQGLNLTPGGRARRGEARTIRAAHLRRPRLPRHGHPLAVEGARADPAHQRGRRRRCSTSRFEVESLRDWDRSHVGVPLGQPFVERAGGARRRQGGRPGRRAGDAAARGGDVGPQHRIRRTICRATSCCAAWTTSRSSARSSASSS